MILESSLRHEQIIDLIPQDLTWFERFDRSLIHPRLFQKFSPESLKRPPHETKLTGGTAYVLLEASTGVPLRSENIGHSCGAACSNCYLIRGGARPDYILSPKKALIMKKSLEEKGFSVIFTGAELLTLPDHFKEGLFDEKSYLLSSGLILATIPDQALSLITRAGINNIQISLHGAAGSENVFGGMPLEIVTQAVKNIRAFNERFGTFIGIVLNVTVGKHNLKQLQKIADFVLSDDFLDGDGIRFNRHKAAGGKYTDLMLDEVDHELFYELVEGIRKKYPKETTGKTINVSGDFGKIKRSGNTNKPPYECPAGIPGGEITIVPRRNGIHEVYSCLEVRNQRLQMGTFNGNKLRLHTKPFELLKNQNLREKVGLDDQGEGCIAYVLTRGDTTSDLVFNYLHETLDINIANLVL